MSLIYDLLKEKATNPETKDKIAYVEIPKIGNHVESMSYRFFLPSFKDYNRTIGFTYADFYELVNNYIDHGDYKASLYPKIYSIDSKPRLKRVIVSNNIASSAAVIAMLELGYIPILVDEMLNFPDPIGFREVASDSYHKIDNELEKVVNVSVPKSRSAGRKNNMLLISSSGSEGVKPHYNVLTEQSLVNSKIQYGEENSTFYSYISSANISGFLANIINPIVYNTTAVVETGFGLEIFDRERRKEKCRDRIVDEWERYTFSPRDPIFQKTLLFEKFTDSEVKLEGSKIKIFYHNKFIFYPDITWDYDDINYKCGTFEELGINIDSVMFPRDILSHLEKYENGLENLDFSQIRHIYLTGGVNRQEVIDAIRKKIPSIQYGVFENLYGATEAGGVICSCPEKDLIPCFINITRYRNNEIIYTYDKKKFYLLTKAGGVEIPCEFDEFDFVSYLPVSNKIEQNVQIDNDFTIKFRDVEDKNWIESSDFGVYIDNKLYVLGRKKALIDVNNKCYFINTIEDYFSRALGAPVLLGKLPTNGCYHIYIDIEKFETLPEKIELYKNAVYASLHLKSITFGRPVLLPHYFFPVSRISGKISRSNLVKNEQYVDAQCDDYLDPEYSKRKFLDDFVKFWIKDVEKERYEVDIDYQNFRFKVKCKDTYFYPFFLNAYFLKIVSLDDDSGTIEFELNDNYMFDAYMRNRMWNDSPRSVERHLEGSLVKDLSRSELNEQTKKLLEEIDDFEKASRPIDLSKMTLEEALNQMRINTIAVVLKSLSFEEAQGLINKMKEKNLSGKIKE